MTGFLASFMTTRPLLPVLAGLAALTALVLPAGGEAGLVVTVPRLVLAALALAGGAAFCLCRREWAILAADSQNSLVFLRRVSEAASAHGMSQPRLRVPAISQKPHAFTVPPK